MNRWKIAAGTILQDARYAFRWFRSNIALTSAIVLTLAFGAGLNTGVFSVLSGMVFRARADTGSSTFFQILSSPAADPGAAPRLFSSSAADFRAYRGAPGVRLLAAWAVAGARVEDDASPTLVMLVSCDFFELYGLRRAASGRLFAPADCTLSGGAPVALVSEGLWRSRFHAALNFVGSRISINRTEYTVAGIVPEDFSGRLRGPGIWVPFTMQAPFYGGVDLFRDDTRPWLTVEGRRSDGHSLKGIERSLTAISSPRTLALTNGSIIEDPSNRVVAASVTALVFGALSLILLLACTNVTMLLLSRAVARRYEMSVRLALGASRGRLLRMAATEGVLLALLSGGISAALAAAVPSVLRRSVTGMPYYPMHTDWIVFAYLAGVTLAAGIATAMLPAAESLRSNLNDSLRRHETAFFAIGRRLKMRELLIAAQVGMSLVLVVGASLFARTEYRLFAADPGFDARHVLVADLAAGSAHAGIAEMETRLQAVPGVDSVSFATAVLWPRFDSAVARTARGRTVPVALSAVSENFFPTLRIPLVRGRGLDVAAPRGVVISENAAAELWPRQQAIGQAFTTADGARWTVAGIARHSGLDNHSAVPRLFRVLDEHTAAASVLVRTGSDTAVVARRVGTVLDQMARTRQLPRTLAEDASDSASRFAVVAGFALFFGVSALALALIGVYGVMTFAVNRRSKEMGIRLALGATRGDILREVFRSGLRPMVWGLIAGLPLAAVFAIGLERAFRSTPTPFSAGDPVAYGAVALLLLTGGVAALLRPALRACSLNPVASLRQE